MSESKIAKNLLLNKTCATCFWNHEYKCRKSQSTIESIKSGIGFPPERTCLDWKEYV